MSEAPLTDSRAYPPRPLLAVSAAVIRAGRILIARRAQAPLAGFWSLPGGLVEAGEGLRAAAARELMEETAVVAEIVAPADIVESIRRDQDGTVERHYVIVSFAARWIAGEGHPGEATDAVHWAHPDEVDSFNLTEGAAEVMRKAHVLLNGTGGTFVVGT